jgi:hypothetical protein
MHSSPREFFLWVVFLAVVSSALVLWKMETHNSRMHAVTANPASRLATIESLAHSGTYAIEHSMFRSIDVAAVRTGHVVSTKPPVLPTIMAGLYSVFHMITGVSFSSNPQEAILFIRLVAGFLPHLVLLLFFAALLYRLVSNSPARILAFVALAFSYPGVLFATDINNHTAGAVTLLMAFFFAFHLRHEEHSRLSTWMLAGFFAGLLPTFDPPSALFSIAIFIYLFSLERQRLFTIFLPCFLLPVAIHFYLVLLATGTIIPLQFHPEWTIPHPVWLAEKGFDSANDPKWLYAFHTLLGHHGIFTMTPVLLLGGMELCRHAARKLSYAAEAWMILVPSVVLTLFYIMWTNNYGGWSVGFRWLIPPMPLFILFSGIWLERHLSRKIVLLYILFISTGMFHVLTSETPWQLSIWQRMF